MSPGEFHLIIIELSSLSRQILGLLTNISLEVWFTSLPCKMWVFAQLTDSFHYNKNCRFGVKCKNHTPLLQIIFLHECPSEFCSYQIWVWKNNICMLGVPLSLCSLVLRGRLLQRLGSVCWGIGPVFLPRMWKFFNSATQRGNNTA